MDLGALYEEVILDHNRSPRNWGEIPGARHVAGTNPLCGDKISLSVQVDGDVITDIRFTGEGCAISKASASMMTQAMKGKTKAEADGAVRGIPRPRDRQGTDAAGQVVRVPARIRRRGPVPDPREVRDDGVACLAEATGFGLQTRDGTRRIIKTLRASLKPEPRSLYPAAARLSSRFATFPTAAPCRSRSRRRTGVPHPARRAGLGAAR